MTPPCSSRIAFTLLTEVATRSQELGAANAECRAYLDRLERVKDYDVVLRQATHMRADMLAAKQQQKDLELKVRLFYVAFVSSQGSLGVLRLF